MVRLFGRNKSKGRKRLNPSARTPESIQRQHPMYQYALNEYAYTVPAGSSNDDGHAVESVVGGIGNGSTTSWTPTAEEGRMMQQQIPAATPPSLPRAPSLVQGRSRGGIPEVLVSEDSMQAPLHTATSGSDNIHATPLTQRVPHSETQSVSSTNYAAHFSAVRPFEHDMPDASYEESYGEAYTGGVIRYQYPTGYGSMRPRSCPWKLSIAICLLFTWLSFFIVGYCSDQVEDGQYRNDKIDDDGLVMEMRWCGSRPLYSMWVASMLITFLSSAYCGVIGYIKFRDFAVANCRSQPPGVAEGKSDYYVRIEDAVYPAMSDAGASTGSAYKPSIYQADGTPQFWGSHIYRPTQAAVAMTSR